MRHTSDKDIPYTLDKLDFTKDTYSEKRHCLVILQSSLVTESFIVTAFFEISMGTLVVTMVMVKFQFKTTGKPLKDSDKKISSINGKPLTNYNWL